MTTIKRKGNLKSVARIANVQIQDLNGQKLKLISDFLTSFTRNGFGGLKLEYSRDRKSWVNIGVRWTGINKRVVLPLIKIKALRAAMIIVVHGRHGWDDYETIYNSFDSGAK
jgi:hypothetical protein